MMVVIASELPPAVRGRMKLWFIEPRPNVFVSGVKDALSERIIRYLVRHCPKNSGLMIFSEIGKAPGYAISVLGKTQPELIEISGLQLVREPPLTTITTKSSVG